MYPSAWATSLAFVLLPLALVPSMAMTLGSLKVVGGYSKVQAWAFLQRAGKHPTPNIQHRTPSDALLPTSFEIRASWSACFRVCLRIGTMNRCASRRRGPDRGSVTRSNAGSWKARTPLTPRIATLNQCGEIVARASRPCESCERDNGVPAE